MKAIVVKYEIDNDVMRVKRNIKVIDAPEKETDNLDFFYKNIGCRMIDAVYFDGFDIFVDDEGLLTSGNVVSEYDYKGQTAPLAGNLVFTKGADNLGKTVWFDEIEDIKLIMSIIEMVERAELRGVTR